jgi:hypothetical protein
LHSKLEPASLAVKEKEAEVDVVVAAGPLVIEVSGAVVSVLGGGGEVEAEGLTLQLRDAGVASTFLAESMARTEKRCAPIATPE